MCLKLEPENEEHSQALKSARDEMDRAQRAEKRRAEKEEKFNRLNPKERAAEHMKREEYAKAILCYTEVIAKDPRDYKVFSNRSAAFARRHMYKEALQDAEMAVCLAPQWAKAYSRKGLALYYLGQLEDAVRAYEHCLHLDPSNSEIKAHILKMKKETEGSKGSRSNNTRSSAERDSSTNCDGIVGSNQNARAGESEQQRVKVSSPADGLLLSGICSSLEALQVLVRSFDIKLNRQSDCMSSILQRVVRIEELQKPSDEHGEEEEPAGAIAQMAAEIERNSCSTGEFSSPSERKSSADSPYVSLKEAKTSNGMALAALEAKNKVVEEMSLKIVALDEELQKERELREDQTFLRQQMEAILVEKTRLAEENACLKREARTMAKEMEILGVQLENATTSARPREEEERVEEEYEEEEVEEETDNTFVLEEVAPLPEPKVNRGFLEDESAETGDENHPREDESEGEKSIEEESGSSEKNAKIDDKEMESNNKNDAGETSSKSVAISAENLLSMFKSADNGSPEDIPDDTDLCDQNEREDACKVFKDVWDSLIDDDDHEEKQGEEEEEEEEEWLRREEEWSQAEEWKNSVGRRVKPPGRERRPLHETFKPLHGMTEDSLLDISNMFMSEKERRRSRQEDSVRAKRIKAAAIRKREAEEAGEFIKETSNDFITQERRGAREGCPGFKVIYRDMDSMDPEVMLHCSMCGYPANEHPVDTKWVNDQKKKQEWEKSFSAKFRQRQGSWQRQNTEKMNACRLLEVPLTASDHQISRAYKKLALKFHPDKNPSQQSQEMFIRLTRAFQTLQNS